MAGKVKTFDCPQCGGTLSVRVPGHTITVVCLHCGTHIDANNNTFQKIQSVKWAMKIDPVIPLGTRGKLRGKEWEVVGFLQRQDLDSGYLWREYLLFNPWYGYRWLAEADGHWSFITPIKSDDSKNYKLFHKGKAKVVFVIGEFYWRIKVNDTVSVADYISPPYSLSWESDSSEENWSQGEYLDPLEVKIAFKLNRIMPYALGIAPNQPSPYTQKTAAIYKTWFLAFIFITFIQFFHYATSDKREVLSKTFSEVSSPSGTTLVSEPFEIEGNYKNLSFDLYSDVDNSWIELDIDLINDVTGENTEFQHGVEYYYGRDSDGSWSEGSKSRNYTLSSVMKGTYHLNIEVSDPLKWTSSNGNPPLTSLARPFSLTVKRDVPTWFNYFVSIFVISAFPIVVWLRSYNFEVKRWLNSDYSPYASGDD